MEDIFPPPDELEPPTYLPQVSEEMRAFSFYYTRLINKVEAAKRAGYQGSDRRLRSKARELAKNPKLRPWIEHYRAELVHKRIANPGEPDGGEGRVVMSPEEVLVNLSDLGREGEAKDRIQALKILAEHYELIGRGRNGKVPPVLKPGSGRVIEVKRAEDLRELARGRLPASAEVVPIREGAADGTG